MDKIWAIVLAGGASTRMGTQKLLLPFRGGTIVESVIRNIQPVVQNNILVVLGSHRDEIREKIEKLPLQICMNENYSDGMLSSVICGFRNLPDDAKAALIFLGDQPQIPTTVSKKVVETWKKTQKGIVIPVFKGRRGHPSLIETKYKPEIERLDPEKGLRELMRKFANDVSEVRCNLPEILRDIDTPEDYEYETNRELIKNKS